LLLSSLPRGEQIVGMARHALILGEIFEMSEPQNKYNPIDVFKLLAAHLVVGITYYNFFRNLKSNYLLIIAQAFALYNAVGNMCYYKKIRHMEITKGGELT